jgi:hypothetical protein
MIRISISIRRAINEIGTSLEPPSNGFEEFSPTFSSEMNSQPITALNGIFNQAVQCSIPACFPKSTAYWIKTKRYNRDKNRHQENGDRIVITRTSYLAQLSRTFRRNGKELPFPCPYVSGITMGIPI